VDYLVMVVVGGWGSITGPAAAAVGLTIINELLRRFAELRMLVYAILLIGIMLLRPQGLLAGKELALPDKWVEFLVKKLSFGKNKEGRSSE
ncbi:MAG: hypothetical protein Q8S19_05655, partial [Bacillota bacterium]|nr:hypothetical protein [Bacillota bacterium]